MSKRKSLDENKILLKNLHASISKEDIRKVFKDCGDIKYINLNIEKFP